MISANHLVTLMCSHSYSFARPVFMWTDEETLQSSLSHIQTLSRLITKHQSCLWVVWQENNPWQFDDLQIIWLRFFWLPWNFPPSSQPHLRHEGSCNWSRYPLLHQGYVPQPLAYSQQWTTTTIVKLNKPSNWWNQSLKFTNLNYH